MTRLTRNVMYNVVGQSLVLVLSLIAVRFIFRRLGNDVFRIIFFNIALTAVLTRVLELGASSTIVREVSSAFDSERAYVRDLVRTASFLYWTIGLLLMLFIWITAPLLVTNWINLTTIDPNTAATMLRILSVPALVALPRGLYTAMFRGRQRMGYNNAIDVGASIVQQFGILVVLLAGGSPYMVAGWISASAALAVLAYILVASRLFGWRTLLPSFSSYVARRNLGFAGRMSLTSVASLVNTQANQVIVSKLLPIGEFGLFGFASSTVNRATLVTGAVAQAAFPSFSNLHRAHNHVGLIVALGLVGAGLSWVAYNAWLYVYLVPRVTRGCLHTPTIAWFAHLAKAFAASLLIYGLAWLAIVVPTGYSVIGSVAAYILATVAFAGAALYLIGPDLKSTLRGLVPTVKRLVRPTPSR